MTPSFDPNDEVRRAIAGLKLWLESDLAFGIEELPKEDRAVNGQRADSAATAPASVTTAATAVTPATSSGGPAPRPPAIPPAGIRVPVAPLAKQLGSNEKVQALAALALEVYGCARCRLCETRTYGVPGEGNADADLMFIGEGPGADEDRSGRPFVGAAGELLTKIVSAMGFSRESVYIANIVKCRPPGNRVPAPDEIASCFPYLRRQIEIVGPKVICTLGAPATQALLGLTTGITKLRGKLYQHGTTPVVPTFHPAYLLRQPADKALVWQDVQFVARLVVERGGSVPHPEVLERSRAK